MNAGVPSGPVTLHARTSFRVSHVYGLSSSQFGTLYLSDRKGGDRLFSRPAPLSSGAAEVDLGPDVSRRIGKTPLIVRDIITIPQPGAHVGDIASVVWCRVGACSPAQRTSIPLTATEVYLTNGGNSVLVYDTDGSRSVRARMLVGPDDTFGTLPFDPSPDGMTAKAVDAPLAGVLAADAQIFYLAWAVAGGMTALSDGALPAFANDVAIFPPVRGRAALRTSGHGDQPVPAGEPQRPVRAFHHARLPAEP